LATTVGAPVLRLPGRGALRYVRRFGSAACGCRNRTNLAVGLQRPTALPSTTSASGQRTRVSSKRHNADIDGLGARSPERSILAGPSATGECVWAKGDCRRPGSTRSAPFLRSPRRWPASHWSKDGSIAGRVRIPRATQGGGCGPGDSRYITGRFGEPNVALICWADRTGEVLAGYGWPQPGCGGRGVRSRSPRRARRRSRPARHRKGRHW
jgi:hypothetical protein